MDKPSGETSNKLQNASKVQANIDLLVEKHGKLKKLSESVEKTKQTWQTRLSKLSDSNYQGKMEMAKLRKETAYLEEKMKLETEVVEDEMQEAANFKDQNMKRRREKLEDFAFETMNVAREFQNAQVDYLSANLTMNIEEYRKESKTINKELENVHGELEALKAKHGHNELNTNFPISDSFIGLYTLKDILMDDSSLLTAIKFSEHTSLQLKNNIKQIKRLMSKKDKPIN